jgi:hypothetical protein
MNKTLQLICTELDQLATQVKAGIPSDEPFNVAQSNWSFPGLTRTDLVDAVTSLAALIRERGTDTVEDNEAQIGDYVRRLQFLRANMIQNIWANAAVAVPNFLNTLDGLRRAVEPSLQASPTGAVATAVKRSVAQVRAIELRLKDIEPRSLKLADMVDRIERAHDAADQLPTDLEALDEGRKKLDDLLQQAVKDRAYILEKREEADRLDASLARSAEEAAAVVARCESAYSSATSQGLAAAFSERSKTLDTSMWIWVLGLVIALLAGAGFGSRQLHSLAELMKSPEATWPMIALNLLLSIMSVGAPIWFAWLATKQVGQRFRLSEDYAFKASISRAYEGYRREAARIDKDLEARLLASALTRLDEVPLRVVETVTHGSPWHELMASDTVRDALKSVPGFANSISDMAKSGLASMAKQPSPSVPAAPIASTPPPAA